MKKNIFSFQTKLRSCGVFYCYSGPFSQDLIVEIAQTIKKKLKSEALEPAKVKSLFSILIEMTQNILRYSDDNGKEYPSEDVNEQMRYGILTVGKDGLKHFVMCGNMVEKPKVNQLKQKLLLLKQMDKTQLKKFIREERKKTIRNNFDNAGLGFIEIARKSSQPVDFDFSEINDKYSLFTIRSVG
jgi:hypothetical protein